MCTIIAAFTITIDAHMVTSGGHYLRADTIPLSSRVSDAIHGSTLWGNFACLYSPRFKLLLSPSFSWGQRLFSAVINSQEVDWLLLSGY